MYPLLMRDNLTIPIQMQFQSRFKKTFSHLFAGFLKFRLNLKYFDTKYDPHRTCITSSLDLEVIIYLIKVLSCKFQQWFGPFTMLLFEGSSKTGFFRHLSDYAFGVCNFANAKYMRVIFLLKIFKI